MYDGGISLIGHLPLSFLEERFYGNFACGLYLVVLFNLFFFSFFVNMFLFVVSFCIF
jgi:hypothetical protein